MTTVILTPLFPPDPSHSARYAKLLAEKLPLENISVIAYGVLPESVDGVRIIPISKRSNKLLLVYRCLRQLLRLRPDTLLVQNGPSTELPALLFSYLRTVCIVYTISDTVAATQRRSWLQTKISRTLKKRAAATLLLPENATTFLPPEWTPFTEPDTTAQQSYETWWNAHLEQLSPYVQRN